MFAGALAVPMAATTSAQPVVTGGLVNVTIVDAVDIEEVQVSVGAALALAANLCDVNVNVLATQLRDGGATCQNAVDGTEVTISQVQ